jgi:hypothetical protein
MCKLTDFYDELEKNRKPKSRDPYDDRTNHCYMIFKGKDGKDHQFQVRGWHWNDKPLIIDVFAVNWTLSAGPCSIEISEKNIDLWKITPINDD